MALRRRSRRASLAPALTSGRVFHTRPSLSQISTLTSGLGSQATPGPTQPHSQPLLRHCQPSVVIYVSLSVFEGIQRTMEDFCYQQKLQRCLPMVMCDSVPAKPMIEVPITSQYRSILTHTPVGVRLLSTSTTWVSVTGMPIGVHTPGSSPGGFSRGAWRLFEHRYSYLGLH